LKIREYFTYNIRYIYEKWFSGQLRAKNGTTIRRFAEKILPLKDKQPDVATFADTVGPVCR
jgi:hypothetical protein